MNLWLKRMHFYFHSAGESKKVTLSNLLLLFGMSEWRGLYLSGTRGDARSARLVFPGDGCPAKLAREPSPEEWAPCKATETRMPPRSFWVSWPTFSILEIISRTYLERPVIPTGKQLVQDAETLFWCMKAPPGHGLRQSCSPVPLFVGCNMVISIRLSRKAVKDYGIHDAGAN